MNKTIPTFCILIAVLLFSNCKKEEIICECDDSCISGEEIIDDTTGIPTFFPGNQEFGFFHSYQSESNDRGKCHCNS